MTPDEIETIRKLSEMLRAQGVRVFEGGEIRLEFGELPDKTKPEAPSVDPEACRCGHPMHAHVNGLCVLGCDAEKCLPEDAKK